MQIKEPSQPKHYRVYEQPFVFSVLKNAKIVSDLLSKQAGEAYAANREPEFAFTPEMAYHFNVNHYLTSLIGTMERLEEVPIFLRRFPNSKYLAENNITLHRWLNYHYSNFLIMSISLYDISLLLTNEVFVLGNEPRNCNQKTVVKNQLVRETSVKIALDKLWQAIDKYREPRNLFVHRGRLPELGFMDHLEIYDFIQKTKQKFEMEQDELDMSDPFSSPIMRQYLYRHERRQLIAKIGQETDVYTDLLCDLFGSLKPIYSILSKTW